MKKVLLVYPKIPKDTYWSFSHALPFIGKKAAIAPLGLITAAAMMPDYELRLIDENVREAKDGDFEWADIVFTSSMVVQSESLETIVKLAKYFGRKVVAGGPYPTQFYDTIDEITGKAIDHFVLGESESGVLRQFLEDFEKGKAKRAYARPALRKLRIKGSNLYR